MSIPITKFGELEKEIKEIEEEAVPLPFIVDNFLGKDGGEVSGAIDMTGQPIKNLPDPTDGGDAVNKNYVDTSQGHSFFRRSPGKGYVASKDLNMNEQRLLNLAMPIDNLEAANKLYTDITANDVKNNLEGQNPFVLNGDKHKARGNVDMINFKLQGLPMPIDDKDAANKIYVDTLTEDRRRKLEVNNPFNFDNGEYEAKNKINMKGFKIEGVGFPDLPEDVATVAYVDEANVWERKNGGFVAKDHIYLGKKKLGGLKEPTANGEAANKNYVDKETKKVADETLKKGDDGFYSAETNLNLNNFRLFGVPDPTREDEVTNKKYVDEKTANLQPAGVDPVATAAELDKIKTDLEKNQAFTTRNQKTFNARGNINMKQKTIRNIPDPVEVTDVVSKGYVDEMKEFFEDRIKEVEDEAKEAKNAADRAARAQPGGGAGNGNGADFGDMKGRKLINVGDPENPGDGVNRKYVDQKTPFTKTNGYYTTTHGIDMDFKKITNLNTPTGAADAVNKQYVDENINSIDTGGLITQPGGIFLAGGEIDMNYRKIIHLPNPVEDTEAVNKKYVDEREGLIRKNGGFISVDAIDMNSNRIKNVGAPQLYDDVTNKVYVDNKVKTVEEQAKTNSEEIEELKEEDGKRKAETDRIRVLVNDKIKDIEEKAKEKEEELKKYVDEETAKILPKERIFKFLGTSIILIRGEAEGPIIGKEEVANSNRRRPSPTAPGGFVSLDDEGEIIQPTIIYFGKYEGGAYEFKLDPRFLIPTSFTIKKYGIFFEGTKKKENFKFDVYFNLQGGNFDRDALYEHTTHSIESDNLVCITTPLVNSMYLQNCNTIALSFVSSHPKVKRFFITFVALLHLPDLNEEWLPQGFDI